MVNGWLIWRNDLRAIINFYFGISKSEAIIKKLLKHQSVDLSNKLSQDEIVWIKKYCLFTVDKSSYQLYSAITVREFEKTI